MSKHKRLLTVIVVGVAVVVAVGAWYRAPAQDKTPGTAEKPAAADKNDTKPDSPEVAALRKTAEEFTQDQATVLVHYGKERTQQMMLVRLPQPAGDQ
jgi:hypothetical protein